ncbi:MAG: recombinase family protein [Oscillospiraceae bacterium]|nr:recombinase family protein [Oscillospiraceae bacterium]
MRKNGDAIAIYSRKSKFTGKGESIGNQVELCKEYVRMHYGEAALEKVEIFEDEGFSGGNLNRPDFKKLMDAARKRKFRAVIVYRLDRISRNVSDFAGLIEELARLDIDFVSIREQFDTSTPMGRAMMYIASVFSQLERETIAERIRDNMHELAKTGRWLGGTTPTGYESEAVESVTIDGKSKKVCKLKLIPEEAEIIKLIFELYKETDSLTATEAELLKRGFKTKNNKNFSRFAIKAILQNPVYAIADEDTYDYFISVDSDLFSEKTDFDGVHGIMAYNRTNQEKGKTTEFLPPSEWIVSVGKHPGMITGKQWIAVQESLERNKNKAYRKPRINEALLTGLIFCSCGERMYPKISKRTTVDGQPVYTYVCKMKERSKKAVCNKRNANGNILDTAVIEQIKMLAENNGVFHQQLEQSRRLFVGNRVQYEDRLAVMLQEKAELERKINSLVDYLVELGDSSARGPIAKRIEEMNHECEDMNARIRELEALTSQQNLTDMEFDLMMQMMRMLRDGIDHMGIEQKRSAVRSVLRKVIWDGTNAHLVLFGAGDEEIEYPDMLSRMDHIGDESEEEDTFDTYENVEFGDLEDENASTGEGAFFGAYKTDWGEGSK